MKSDRNKTIYLTEDIISENINRCITLTDKRVMDINNIINKTIVGDSFEVLKKIPNFSVDLIITDPPYNIEKKFNEFSFKRIEDDEYCLWMHGWMQELFRILKPTGSIYVCCDWKTSPLVYSVLKHYFIVRNRITWERDKGRSCNSNWKNNIEDIYFATRSDDYVFNLDKVMVKKSVIAPYKDENGNPKDWFEDGNKKFRLTAPSNVWTDITVPYWSMPENTEHPTQKPEKLIAKLMLASSNEGDVVLDPFLGSGTTSVVAKKIKRMYIGVEVDRAYAALSEYRLSKAIGLIQGYNGQYFLEKGKIA